MQWKETQRKEVQKLSKSEEELLFRKLCEKHRKIPSQVPEWN